MRAGSLATHWWLGRYGIQRRCECSKGNRAAECLDAGWHLVDSSDDLADALSHAAKLAPHGTYRVVDQRDGVVQVPGAAQSGAA